MPSGGHNGEMLSNFAERQLYLCTPLRDDLLEFVASTIRGGVDIVQLREKDADDSTIAQAGRELAQLCRDHGVPFIMNDSIVLAQETNADGVHVGQDDSSVSTCRSALGPDAIIGLSTHEASELDDALGSEATYLSAGPIVATPTKPGRAGTGADYVAYALSRANRPVFVTGGIDRAAIPDLWALGVRHFVVVRALTQASYPEAAARELRDAIARCQDN